MTNATSYWTVRDFIEEINKYFSQEKPPRSNHSERVYKFLLLLKKEII